MYFVSVFRTKIDRVNVKSHDCMIYRTECGVMDYLSLLFITWMSNILEKSFVLHSLLFASFLSNW